ncbi:unnamed protein product [Brassica rapa subsp. trilocularis]
MDAQTSFYVPIKYQRQSRRRCNLLRGIARTLPQSQDDTWRDEFGRVQRPFVWRR